MAVDFAIDAKRADTLYTFWPEEIVLDPELNGRLEHTSVEDLTADIEANGQDTPVTIRKNDDNLPVLVAGHRRFRAISLLNERNPDSKRKIVCRYRNLTDRQAFETTIRENRFRKDVSAIDDCHNINLLKTRWNLSDEDIATIYDPDAKEGKEREAAIRFVKDRSALSQLAPEVADAVRTGDVPITAAKALAKLSKNQQRKELKRGGGKVKVADVIKLPKKIDFNKGLLKRVVAMLEDIKGMLNDKEFQYIEIDRLQLLTISAWIDAHKPVK